MKDITAYRNEIIEAIGFDIFTSPRFLQALAVKMLSADPTDEYSAHADGIDPAGITIEVKSSQLHTKRSGEGYCFRRVLGTNRSKVGSVGVYIFIGHNGNGRLDCWRIPGIVVEAHMQKRKDGDLWFALPEKKRLAWQKQWYWLVIQSERNEYS